MMVTPLPGSHHVTQLLACPQTHKDIYPLPQVLELKVCMTMPLPQTLVLKLDYNNTRTPLTLGRVSS